MTLTLGYIPTVLIVVFLVDLGLRTIPFLILEPLRGSRFMRAMGVWMSARTLSVLTIVSVQSNLASVPGKAWAIIVASAIAVATRLLGGRRMVVSIAAEILSYASFINL